MSEYPANSAGDLFRLLPFEGYAGVLSFLPVRQLQLATQISKGWQFAVGCRAVTYDASVTCKDIGDLTKFLASYLTQSSFVSAIRCDVAALAMNTTELSFQPEILLPQISQVTWRCARSCDYHSNFMHVVFPRLKALKIEVAIRCFEDSHFVTPRFKNSFRSLRCLSVVAEGFRGRRLVQTPWSGEYLPHNLKSLRLEGVTFSGLSACEDDADIFGGFLVNQMALTALHLDVDSAWWRKWGCRFEDGILQWIRARRRIERFEM